jgi:hypothetical protein
MFGIYNHVNLDFVQARNCQVALHFTGTWEEYSYSYAHRPQPASSAVLNSIFYLCCTYIYRVLIVGAGLKYTI